ncbi:MAG: hypothetical protein IT458_05855, partial [Planctomycetes bacterium]|nr:hypothetical protein [Planctomycetota bacterium]
MKRNTIRALVAAGAVLPLMSYVFFSGSPRWPLSGGFHYVVDLNTTSFPAGSVWDNNAQYSLSDWRDMGSTGFLPGYTRTNSDFNDHGNGRNSWVWLNRPSDGWLGITFVRWSGSTMVDCDIWYNSRPDYLWTNGLTDPSASRPYWPIEFRNVARHEAGHAIGFDHENRTLAQMNSISQHGAGVPHTTSTGMLPHADEKAGCRVLYPGSGTTWNVMSTVWREPDQVANNGARKLTLSGSYAAGTAVTMPVWLTNQSNATVPGLAAGIRVGIYLSTNAIISTGDTRIAEYTFTGDWPAHAAGYYTLGGTIPSSMPAGSYYVGAIFDNTGVVAERYETDNDSYVGPITVTNTAYT